MGKTYIFDLDGTLIDSMTPAVKMVLGLLDERGVSYPDDIVNTMLPLGFRGISHYFVERFSLSETPEQLYEIILARARRLYEEEVQAKPKAVETLRAFKARGAHLHVLTASPHAFLDPCLERLGVSALFDNLFSCEDFQRSKGDTQLYVEVAQRIGVRVEDCYVIDDSEHALRTAKRAGMHAIGVYDSYSAQYADAIRAFADGYAYTLDELL